MDLVLQCSNLGYVTLNPPCYDVMWSYAALTHSPHCIVMIHGLRQSYSSFIYLLQDCRTKLFPSPLPPIFPTLHSDVTWP